jgi:hypothetical protein
MFHSLNWFLFRFITRTDNSFKLHHLTGCNLIFDSIDIGFLANYVSVQIVIVCFVFPSLGAFLKIFVVSKRNKKGYETTEKDLKSFKSHYPPQKYPRPLKIGHTKMVEIHPKSSIITSVRTE